jgi:hypothetical protein
MMRGEFPKPGCAVKPTGPRTADAWVSVNGCQVNIGALEDFSRTLPKGGAR